MPELDKYIKHHPLPNKGKKPGKMQCITLHLSTGNAYMGPQDNNQEEDEEESEEEVDLAEVDSTVVMTQETVIWTVNQPKMTVSLQMLLCLILLQAPDLEEEWDQWHKKNIFFPKSMYVSYKTILFKQNIASCKLFDLI